MGHHSFFMNRPVDQWIRDILDVIGLKDLEILASLPLDSGP
jgi:hypothetical protein